MDIRLQIIMVIASIAFMCYVLVMVRNKKIELKYILMWLIAGISFIVISIFPDVLIFLSKLLSIKEPVNTLFLSIIFFMLLIILTLTIAISRNGLRVKSLTQEIGIIQLELEKLKKKLP